MNVLSVLLWIPAILIRWFFVLLGLPAVGFSMVGDGVKRTPSIWKFWADSAAIDKWWSAAEIEWWMYLYTPAVAALAYYAYGNWHPLIAIYFIFTTLAALLVTFNKERFTKFWWFAIRNPTHGFADMFEQPIQEPRPNPDDLVYGGKQKSASRFLRHGIFSEYWYLRAVGNAIGGKKFEFRIGWKFADGTDGFTPTVQLRYGN